MNLLVFGALLAVATGALLALSWAWRTGYAEREAREAAIKQAIAGSNPKDMRRVRR